MLLISVAVIVGAPWLPEDPDGLANRDLQMMYGLIGVLALFGLFKGFRRWRREIVIDDDGLKVLDRGHPQWSVSWEEYGGWAIPKNGRVVVLDRSGTAVGSTDVGVPGVVSGRTPNRRLLIGELEKHLPEGGFRPPPKGPPQPPKVLTTPARCLAVILVGVAVSAAGFYGLDQMLRGAREGDNATGVAFWLWKHQLAWPLLLLPTTLGPTLILQGGFSWHRLIKAPWNRPEAKDQSGT